VHLPKQEKEEVTPEELQKDPEPPLVLRVGPNRTIQVNGVDLAFEELSGRLKRMFAARDDHILFFDAADDANYGFAVEVLDQAREGGAVTIAPLTKELTQQPPPGTAPGELAPSTDAPPPGAPADAPPAGAPAS
jgi:biopolymer transport protein TolR